MSNKLTHVLAEINEILPIQSVLLWVFDPGSDGKFTISFKGTGVHMVEFSITTKADGTAQISFAEVSSLTHIRTAKLIDLMSVLNSAKTCNFKINHDIIRKSVPATATLRTDDHRKNKVGA